MPGTTIGSALRYSENDSGPEVGIWEAALLDCERITGNPEVMLGPLDNFRLADKPLVIHVPKDGGVQIRVACRKKDKRRRSGRPAQ